MSEEMNKKIDEMSDNITKICIEGGSDEELENAIKESEETTKTEKSINETINELANAVTKAINKKAEAPAAEPKKKPFKLGLFGYLGLACICKTVVEVARAVADSKKPRR